MGAFVKVAKIQCVVISIFVIVAMYNLHSRAISNGGKEHGVGLHDISEVDGGCGGNGRWIKIWCVWGTHGAGKFVGVEDARDEQATFI